MIQIGSSILREYGVLWIVLLVATKFTTRFFSPLGVVLFCASLTLT